MGIYYVISIVILVACVFLVLVVLVQNSKGGGLASNFQSQNQYMGVRKTTDFIEKATWTIAIIICVLSLVSVFLIPNSSKYQNTSGTDTELRDIIESSNESQTQSADTYQAPPETK